MLEKKIPVPENLAVEIHGKNLVVKGNKGTLEKSFEDPKFLSISIEKSGNEITVSSSKDTKKYRAMIGTIVAHLNNMFIGVTSGYKYTLKIFYTHFPINITVKDKEIQIRNFLGEKGARIAKITGKIEVKIEKDEILLSGINKEELGQTSANIELACKITKRDRRVFQDGIYLAARAAA